MTARSQTVTRILLQIESDPSVAKQLLPLLYDERMDLEINCPASNERPDRLLAIDEALARLEAEHTMARLLKLRYFAGVPFNDTG